MRSTDRQRPARAVVDRLTVAELDHLDVDIDGVDVDHLGLVRRPSRQPLQRHQCSEDSDDRGDS